MPVRAELRPQGPYSLRVSGRHASDATRVVVDGTYRATVRVDGRLERVHAAQRADGTIVVAADSDAGVDHVRFALGLDDDHSEFLRRFADDPLLGETLRRLRGLRPMRTGTVAQALLRAVAGQLIQASRARQIERTVIRAATPELGGLHAPPTSADLARFSPAELGRLGLGARRERRRRAARARARARAVVGRRRLHRGARPLRARARARPRPCQAGLCALGTLGRAGGSRRAAGALRRVGRARERLSPGGLRARSRTLAPCPSRLTSTSSTIPPRSSPG